MKTYLQNESENRQFSKGRPFMTRGLLIEKSVFLTGHVLQTASLFLQNWLILHSDETGPKTVAADGTDARFKRRPHKMPFGQ